MELAAGGVPEPEQMAALAAAVRLAFSAGGPAADPTPAVYRSRWRRAAMVEMTQLPVGIKDNGGAWGGTA